MNLPADIEGLHQTLNSPDIVDEKWYRRNHGAYELVSSVNHLIALCTAGNFEMLPTFINRIGGYLGDGGDKYVSDKYVMLVKCYIESLGKYLHPEAPKARPQ